VQTAGKLFLFMIQEDSIEFLLTAAKRRLWLRVDSSVSPHQSQGKETVLFTASKSTTVIFGKLICLDQEVRELLRLA
jgi:hypothetical protein